MKLLDSTKLGIIAWGTKTGNSVFFSCNISESNTDLKPELNDWHNFTNVDGINQTSYTIERYEEKLGFTKYHSILDSSGRGGYYAITLVAGKETKIPHNIVAVLDSLSELYYDEYIANSSQRNRISVYADESPELFGQKLDETIGGCELLEMATLQDGSNKLAATYESSDVLNECINSVIENSNNISQLVLLPDANASISCKNEDDYAFVPISEIVSGLHILKLQELSELPTEEESVPEKTEGEDEIIDITVDPSEIPGNDNFKKDFLTGTNGINTALIAGGVAVILFLVLLIVLFAGGSQFDETAYEQSLEEIVKKTDNNTLSITSALDSIDAKALEQKKLFVDDATLIDSLSKHHRQILQDKINEQEEKANLESRLNRLLKSDKFDLQDALEIDTLYERITPADSITKRKLSVYTSLCQHIDTLKTFIYCENQAEYPQDAFNVRKRYAQKLYEIDALNESNKEQLSKYLDEIGIKNQLELTKEQKKSLNLYYDLLYNKTLSVGSKKNLKVYINDVISSNTKLSRLERTSRKKELIDFYNQNKDGK